jgi:hypothetical protein
MVVKEKNGSESEKTSKIMLVPAINLKMVKTMMN